MFYHQYRLNILNVSSKIILAVAASMLLATAILSTIGHKAWAGWLGLAACGLLIVGIVLLLIQNVGRGSKGMGEDKG